MLIRNNNQGFVHSLNSEITSQTQYLQRRAFMQGGFKPEVQHPWIQ